MTILYQYIARTVFQSLGIIMLALLSLGFFLNLVSETYAIGRGDYTLWAAMIYSLALLPHLAYQFFPIACLLASLMGLSQLANHSELIAMRASGLSIFNITKPIVLLGMCLVILTVLLGEGIAPYIGHQAQTYKAELKSGGRALSTASGLWLRDGQRFIHVGKLLPGGRMENITEYELNENLGFTASRYAKSARYQNGQWLLSDIHESKLANKSIETTTHAGQNWQISLNPDWLRVARITPDEMSLFDLQQYLQYLNKNNLKATQFSTLFWARLIQPLSTLIIMIIPIPLLFGPLRHATMGFRLVVGIMVGFVFYILNQMAGPLSAALQLPAPIVFLLPPVLFLSLYAYLAYRHQ